MHHISFGRELVESRKQKVRPLCIIPSAKIQTAVREQTEGARRRHMSTKIQENHPAKYVNFEATKMSDCAVVLDVSARTDFLCLERRLFHSGHCIVE